MKATSVSDRNSSHTKFSCVACETPQTRTFSYKGYSYRRCPTCGLISTYPVPDPETIQQHYAEGFDEGNYHLLLKYSPQYASVYREDADILTRRLRRYGMDVSKLAVLDIGCFTGGFLRVMQDRGADVYGLELQAKAVEIASRDMPGRIFQADVFSNDFPQRKFDAITMFSLLEHVVDPIKLLARSSELLRPGGIIMTQTPDCGSLLAQIMGKYWPPYVPVEHFHYFSTKSLAMVLRRLGFEHLVFRPQWKHLPIDYVYNMFETYSPLFYKTARPVFRLLPQRITKRSLPFYVGGMTTLARKVAQPR